MPISGSLLDVLIGRAAASARHEYNYRQFPAFLRKDGLEGLAGSQYSFEEEIALEKEEQRKRAAAGLAYEAKRAPSSRPLATMPAGGWLCSTGCVRERCSG